MTIRARLAAIMLMPIAAVTVPGLRLSEARAKPPASTRIHCDYADFEFEPGSSTADVIDRTFRDEVATTIGDVKATPKSVMIGWDRTLSTPLGPRTIQSRYLIDRATGAATVSQRDDIPGTDPIVTEDAKHKCTVMP